ncbi:MULTISPECIES: ABC transporter permease [Actinoalloteichus]|uniref:ABC-type dipeptide/oligopeptide/nickel transport system, permease component n=1 Tax=Actinoalloteichus fjordicus TaxID=1612552 RepID=A0AAC9PU07_9PSEU|nr:MULTISPECIES: ABC transporter permease [Actinoalloteichus]APU16446.1 ABC-type dipeptide/oligopeptide/nickel transport system, permease component [Actinoalloteichus fjordicus]APU22505.1 ABC-type dipeptide/oligopeptide/nickel transport system, permease component [Actinoalloteichus sp. GBA129-24]
MLRFIIMRVLHVIPTLVAISVIAFFIIQLPPGDFLTTQIASLEAQGQSLDPAQLDALRARYGIGDPFWVQYWKWISNILLHGDFGLSFQFQRPVSALIAERLPLTLALGVATLLFTWAIALPAGVYSAMKQHSFGDYTISGIGFIALAVPNFLAALVLAYLGFELFGQSVGGLFSPEMVNAPWSMAKFVDLLEHLWIPVLVIGLAGTAGVIRVTRANMLDELNKPYVTTARAKGLSEGRLVTKYPLRIAMNPFISTAGWHLPSLFDGEIIVAQVLALSTIGPLLLTALRSQDMYLAGGIILIIAVLTVIGTLLSDILLAAVDPRVRFGKA